MEKVSVIIPAYNVERFIAECVNSVRSQTYKDLEIIIIDDGSTDSTFDICQKLADEDERIKLIQNNHGGVSRARNSGLDNATGDYIVSVDSDDIILPDMIETLYNKMVEADADIVVCGCRFITEEGEPLYDKCPVREWVISGRDALLSQHGEMGADAMLAAPWGKLSKREVYEGKRYREGIVYEDRHLMPYLYYGVERMAIIPFCGCLYRQRGGSIMHTTPSPERYKLLFEVLNDHVEYYEKMGDAELEYATRKHIADLILASARTGVPKGLEKYTENEFRKHKKLLFKNGVTKKDKIKYTLFTALGVKGYRALAGKK